MGSTGTPCRQELPTVREFSQDLQPFAKILKKFFDFEKDDYEKDADQRTHDCDMLKSKASMVSYSYGLKRRVLETDRNADCSWSTKSRVAEARGKAEVIKSYYEGREAKEQKVLGLDLFFRFQKDEAGKTKADMVKRDLEADADGQGHQVGGEMLAGLAKIPASLDGEVERRWGTEDLQVRGH